MKTLNKVVLGFTALTLSFSAIAQNDSNKSSNDTSDLKTTHSTTVESNTSHHKSNTGKLQVDHHAKAQERVGNDMTMDDNGNMYITDSNEQAIYKIDTIGRSTVFVKNTGFGVEGVTLTSITWHPDGFLLATHNIGNDLWKIPVNDPYNFVRVKISGDLPQVDGIYLDEQNNLVLIDKNGVGGHKPFFLTSKDDWKTAVVMGNTALDEHIKKSATKREHHSSEE